MTTYLLSQTEIGRAAEAAAILSAVSPRNVVEIVQGPYDIIAHAEDREAEADLIDRRTGEPFIRVLPCRSQVS